MTSASSKIHHVVFAVAPERKAAMARLFGELGFVLEHAELAELGLHVYLDWDGGIELISPITDSTGEVAAHVWEFLNTRGDGIYTVVLGVPGAEPALSVAERFGATVRFRQRMEGEGTYLEEIDLSVLDLPLTLLATNLP